MIFGKFEVITTYNFMIEIQMSLKNCFEKLITFYELLNNRFFLDQGLFEPLVSVAAEIFKQKQRTLSSKKLKFFYENGS